MRFHRLSCQVCRGDIEFADTVFGLVQFQAQGIAAKAVTPFLLNRIFELTEGRSLAANIALVLNNARLAAAIARHLI